MQRTFSACFAINLGVANDLTMPGGKTKRMAWVMTLKGALQFRINPQLCAEFYFTNLSWLITSQRHEIKSKKSVKSPKLLSGQIFN